MEVMRQAPAALPRRGPELSNSLLRAQLEAAGAADGGTIRLVYLEGRTVYFVLHPTSETVSGAQLDQLGRRLLGELGFEPLLEELAAG